MHHVIQMLESHPQATPNETLGRCIAACAICSQSCTSCADACLAEEGVRELRRCIRLNLDCADVCAATARVLSRQTNFEPSLARALLEACAEACRLCAEECEWHAEHMKMDHCRVCADACRRCERACEEMLSAIAV
jgi:hypothetical protein